MVSVFRVFCVFSPYFFSQVTSPFVLVSLVHFLPILLSHYYTCRLRRGSVELANQYLPPQIRIMGGSSFIPYTTPLSAFIIYIRTMFMLLSIIGLPF